MVEGAAIFAAAGNGAVFAAAVADDFLEGAFAAVACAAVPFDALAAAAFTGLVAFISGVVFAGVPLSCPRRELGDVAAPFIQINLFLVRSWIYHAAGTNPWRNGADSAA